VIGEDAEVDKLIQWAIDAARLDPSPSSDDEQSQNCALPISQRQSLSLSISSPLTANLSLSLSLSLFSGVFRSPGISPKRERGKKKRPIQSLRCSTNFS
jgi:hypothetical protein